MLSIVSTVERAFDLAKGGTCHNIDDIRRLLKHEGFNNVDAHLGGATIKKQLNALIKAHRQRSLPA